MDRLDIDVIDGVFPQDGSVTPSSPSNKLPTRLYVRHEAFWDGTLPSDILKKHTTLHGGDDPSYGLRVLQEISKRNRSAVLKYTAWLSLAKSVLNCTKTTARILFELFLSIHSKQSLHPDKPPTWSSVDTCEFLVFLYLQLHADWVADRISPSNSTENLASPRSASPRNKARHRKSYSMEFKGKLSLNTPQSANDDSPTKTRSKQANISQIDLRLTRFLHSHLANIMKLLRDPTKLLHSASMDRLGYSAIETESDNEQKEPSDRRGRPQRGFSAYRSRSRSGSTDDMSDFRNDSGSESETSQRDRLRVKNSRHTLQLHEFDRLGFLIAHVAGPSSLPIASPGRINIDGIPAAGAARSTAQPPLSLLTPFWQNDPHAEISLTALRDWVLRHLHPVPLVRIAPSLSAGNPSVWASDYQLVKTTFLSDQGPCTVVCDREVLMNGDFRMRGCKGSSVFLTAPSRFISISKCSRCTLHLGLCTSLIHIDNCSDLVIHAVTRNIRASNLRNVTMYVSSSTRPVIIGQDSNVTLAPYNTSYPGLHEDLERTSIGISLTTWRVPIMFPTEPRDESSTNGSVDMKEEEDVETLARSVGVAFMTPDSFSVQTFPLATELKVHRSNVPHPQVSPSAKAQKVKGITVEVEPQWEPPIPRDMYIALRTRNRNIMSVRQMIDTAKLSEEEKQRVQEHVSKAFQDWLDSVHEGVTQQHMQNLKRFSSKWAARQKSVREHTERLQSRTSSEKKLHLHPSPMNADANGTNGANSNNRFRFGDDKTNK